jgi:glycosyltransferase involved in cell wall biosynthesis
MQDSLHKTADVAIVPCFNEGRNPVDLYTALTSVADLSVVFIDDGSNAESAAVLEALSHEPRVRVVRNSARIGKVASLLAVLRSFGPQTQKFVLVDCDVTMDAAAPRAILEELERSDLVLANARSLQHARTIWERGAVFSANRHVRLRDRHIDRYPALCTNGRMLGMSRRLVDAILQSDVPRHTEDSHFMLVCLEAGYRYSLRSDALLQYRAPNTLGDYFKQSDRFSEGRELLRERWPEELLARRYDPGAYDLMSTFVVEALRDPLGAGVFALMLAAKSARGRRARTQKGAWAVAGSTKVLR